MKNKVLSLVLCVLMMCATALIVNKSLFGHRFSGQTNNNVDSGPIVPITALSDGSLIINTSSLTDAVGYSGPVPLEITIRDGRIDGIKALPNSETPSFFNRASDLFSRYIGMTVREAADLQPDGISGATYSSSAVIANMDAGLDFFLDTPPDDVSAETPWKIWVAFAVTLAACILPLFVKKPIYNLAQMIANIVVLGFWCGQFLDYTLMLKYLSSGIAFPIGLTALVMLAAAFVFPLFGHPQHYCNHICPLGSAQMLVAELCHYKIHIDKRLVKALDWFRKILWAVLMLLLWADVLTGWLDLELFRAFLYESAPIGLIVAALLFVALSSIVSRPYCRFVCPTGSLFKRAENIG